MRPLLATAALCLLLAHLVYAGEGYECGHVPPERVGYTATTSSRTRRQATERQPIRIVPVYLEDDFNQLTPDMRVKYKSVAVQAIDFLSSFLKVERLTKNITLTRFCNTSEQLRGHYPYDHCTPDEPCQDTYCVFPEYPIPQEHLKACKTCDTIGSTNCSTDGQDGPGVPDADMFVYVAARAFRCGGSTLAYASYCFLDKNTDRPVAGIVNLCPNLATEQDIDNIVLAVTHELTHALAFTTFLFPYYRDENGNPRTPRNETTGLPPRQNGKFVESNDTTISGTVKREALNGEYDIAIRKVVTPAVLREARSHFGCPTLDGMELENLGGSGTRYTHWKKRLVENEGMTGQISTNGVFSRLTFALFEDSGWYDVDYSYASPMRSGLCLGCDFTEQSCFTYGLDRAPFCNRPLTDGTTSCTYDRLASARCDLLSFTLFNLTVPMQYQYFDDPTLGGSQELSDYCPVYSATALTHCQRPRDLGPNILFQSLSSRSKCVEFEIRTSFQLNNVTFQPFNGEACYEISCASEGSVSITVGQNTIICQSAGQEVNIEAGGFSFVVICPAYEDICWENFTTCPAPPTAFPAAPPSGLSQGGAIAIGIIFGLVLPLVAVVAVVVVVVVVMMHRRRAGGKTVTSEKGKAPPVTLDSYSPVGKDVALEVKT